MNSTFLLLFSVYVLSSCARDKRVLLSELFANGAAPKSPAESIQYKRRSIVNSAKAEKVRQMNATLFQQTIVVNSGDGIKTPRGGRLSQNTLDTGTVKLGIEDVFYYIYESYKDDPTRCDFGALDTDLTLTEDCGDFRCTFPETMCRLSRQDDSLSCWRITDSCLEGLQEEYGTTITTTTSTTTTIGNTIGIGNDPERYDYSSAAFLIESNPDICGDIGLPDFNAVPTRDCSEQVSCRLPQSICRVNINEDTYDCYLLPHNCRILIDSEQRPGVTSRPRTTTRAPTTTRSTTTPRSTTTSRGSKEDESNESEKSLPFANKPIKTTTTTTTSTTTVAAAPIAVTKNFEDVIIDRLKSRSSHHSLCCYWASRDQCSANISFMRQFCGGACADNRCRGLAASLASNSQLPNGFAV